MSNDSQDWYYAGNAGQAGPVSKTVLEQMWRDGVIVSDTLVWREGLPDWLPLSAAMALGETGPYATAGEAIPYAQPTINYFTPPVQGMPYAGFWMRVLAVIVDGLILGVPGYAVSFAITYAGQQLRQPIAATVLDQVVGLVIGWLYYALFESSAKQATWGKQLCGLIVVDEVGNRLSFGRATGRHFASILSSLILGIGYLMAAFTDRKQTLHDIMAGTLCLYGKRP